MAEKENMKKEMSAAGGSPALIKEYGNGIVKLYKCVDKVNGYTIARYELEGKTYAIKDDIKRYFINKKVLAFPRWDPQKRRWIFWSWMSEKKVIDYIGAKLRNAGILKDEKRRQLQAKKIERDGHRYNQEKVIGINEWFERHTGDWTNITMDYDIND